MLQESPGPAELLSAGAIFTLMVVTLGPVKILGPFAQLTREIDEKLERQIAFRAFLFSVAAILLAGIAGVTLLNNWHIEVPSLSLAGGLIFLIIGLRLVLEQYQPEPPQLPPLPPNPTVAALKLTFPTIVTPYGIAAAMVLLAKSQTESRTALIIGILIVVMLLNYGAMLIARKAMGGVTAMILRIVGAVLGVLQVALAVEMIMVSLRQMGVLGGS